MIGGAPRVLALLTSLIGVAQAHPIHSRADGRPTLTPTLVSITDAALYAGPVADPGVVMSLNTLELVLDPGAIWPGAKAFVSGWFFVGGQGSTNQVGDTQVWSNIEAPPSVRLASAFLEAPLGVLPGRIKLGRMDANDDFALATSASTFVQSSMGFSPTVFAFTSFPEPAWGGLVEIGEGHQVRAGVFDGSLGRGISPGERLLPPAEGPLLVLAELDPHWSLTADRPGHLILGGSLHSGPVPGLDPDTSVQSVYGLHSLVEQTLWSRGPHALTVFAQIARTHNAASLFRDHLGFGVVATAPFTGRPEDSLGAGFSRVTFEGDRLTPETSTSVYYAWALAPWITLQPDLQLLTGGGVVERGPVLVGNLRTTLTL